MRAAGRVFLALVVLVAVMAPAVAAGPFAAVSARYIEELGGGIGGGYQFKSGIVLLGTVTYDRFDKIDGLTEYRRWCETYQVPYTTGPTGHRGVEILVAFPLKRR